VFIRSAERKLFGEHPDNKQYHACGYCGISDIKGRPVIAPPVQVYEVDYLSPADAVDKIADGAPENEGKGNRGIEAPGPEPAQKVKNEGYGAERGKDKQNGLSGARLSGKDAEGNALVSGVKDGETGFEDRNRVMEGEMLLDELLGVLIKRDHCQGYNAGEEMFVCGLCGHGLD
jgi:hypothetical protein